MWVALVHLSPQMSGAPVQTDVAKTNKPTPPGETM